MLFPEVIKSKEEYIWIGRDGSFPLLLFILFPCDVPVERNAFASVLIVDSFPRKLIQWHFFVCMCLHTCTPSTTHTTHRDLMNYNKVNLPLREGSTLNVANRQSDLRVFQTEIINLVPDKWSLRSETLWRSPFPCCFPLLFPFESPHHLPLCVCYMPVFKKSTATGRWELP